MLCHNDWFFLFVDVGSFIGVLVEGGALDLVNFSTKCGLLWLQALSCDKWCSFFEEQTGDGGDSKFVSNS